MAPGNGWEEWSKFVLKELKRLSNASESFPKAMQKLTEKVNEELTELKTEVAMLKVKSGVYGLVGGAILLLAFYISKLIGG